MTTYTINLTNGNLLATIAPQTTNTSSSPITLWGQGLTNYGQNLNTDMVHLVEHFSNITAPSNPLVGTLWYDSGYKIFRVWNGTAWIGLRPDTTPNDAGISTVLISSSPSIVGLMSNGKLIATVSAIQVNSFNIPAQISFRDSNYAFASRFPNGIGAGITIATDVELALNDNSNTLVTAKWINSQGFITSLSSGFVTTSLGYTPLNPANNLSEIVSKSISRNNLGLGSLSIQDAGSVSISGGAINGTPIGAASENTGKFTTLTLTSAQLAKTVLAAPTSGNGAPSFRQLTSADIAGVVSTGNALVPANNLGDVASASSSRSNLGLGTIATQDSSTVAITGGTIDGTAIGNTTQSTVKATSYSVGTHQVVDSRKTGWTAPTGTLSRATFDTATVSTTVLAEVVAALLADLTSHGLIGS